MLQLRCSLAYCNTHIRFLLYSIVLKLKLFKKNGLLWAQDPPSEFNQILFEKNIFKTSFLHKLYTNFVFLPCKFACYFDGKLFTVFFWVKFQVNQVQSKPMQVN